MENLTYRPLTEADKREICDWKYEGDYALYNLPSFEEMQEQQMGFMDPASEKNYVAFLDGETLVGFVNILEEKLADADVCGGVITFDMKPYEIKSFRIK